MIRIENGEWKSNIMKHISEKEKNHIQSITDAQDGDLIIIGIGIHYWVKNSTIIPSYRSLLKC
jgi:hypothetical protein